MGSLDWRAGLQGSPPLAAGRCEVAAALAAARSPSSSVGQEPVRERRVITGAGPFVMLNDLRRPQVLIIRGAGGLPLRAVPAASVPCGCLLYTSPSPRDGLLS